MISWAMVVGYCAGWISPWAAAVTIIIRSFGKLWGVNTWLHRQQVYEADAIAPAISMSSGVKPDTVLTSMQRAYYADESVPSKTALQLVRKQRIQWHLAKLQSLLPDSQIPQHDFHDSIGMQQVTTAAAREISHASQQVKAEYSQSIAVLKACLAEELADLRSPYGAWTDINPHWLDRIARMEKMLKSASCSNIEAHSVKVDRPNPLHSMEHPNR